MAVVLGGEGKPAQDWGPFSDSHGSSHRQCWRGHHPTMRPECPGLIQPVNTAFSAPSRRAVCSAGCFLPASD